MILSWTEEYRLGLEIHTGEVVCFTLDVVLGCGVTEL